MTQHTELQVFGPQSYMSPIPGLAPPSILNCQYDGPDLGPVLCFVLQSGSPLGSPESYMKTVSGPALTIIPILIIALAAILILGFVVGFFYARTRSTQCIIAAMDAPETYRTWRREKNTTVLTFLLVCSGLVFLFIGVSGAVDVEMFGAKISTSGPGAALIAFACLLWLKTYSGRI